MNAQSILKETEAKMKKAEEVTLNELSRIRGGRSQPNLVENIRVDYYGTQTPLRQLAGITTPEPRLIVVQPWDASSIAEIEKAILKSGIGITPQNDGKVIRLSIPPLTQERREELAKLAHKIAEEGRVSIRAIRREANETVKKSETGKLMTEDDSRRSQEQIQKMTDHNISEIDKHLKQKEAEIREV